MMKNLWHKLLQLSSSEKIDLVARCQVLPFFSELNHGEMHFFLRSAIYRAFREDEVIFKKGAAAAIGHFIISGSVGLYKQDRDRAGERVRYLKAGECLGAEAFWGVPVRQVAARTQEETELISIPKSDFDSFLKTKPGIAAKILRSVAQDVDNHLTAVENELQQLTHSLTKAKIVV